MIDTSELLRVFGTLGGDTSCDDNMLQKATQEKYSGDSSLVTELQAKLQVLQAENKALLARVDDKERNLEDIRQALRLLEDQRPKKAQDKPWWAKLW
jgi:hypothetical protein